MDEPVSVTINDGVTTRPVFVSYATADRKQALAVCQALERRGAECWLACRDVQPGENYQEAIVREIRGARAMVLVFSDAANNSDEIKKELSLASRHHVPVMALRIEDVEPSDAFAYELSTRQWIDAFAGWDKSLDALVGRINHMAETTSGAPLTEPRRRRSGRVPGRRLSPRAIAGAGLAVVLLLAGIAAWIILRPAPATAPTMQVRLTGFERLSSDLPASLPDAMRDEMIAAFNKDGVIGVSTSAAPPPGTAPAYALSGTVRSESDKIRVIAKLTNERSGTTLWSNTYIYDRTRGMRVPRYVAVEAGSLVRCGLFGASTYPKPLPDRVMSDYLQVCEGANFARDPARALDFARKVVAAEPKFSWGWSSLAIAALEVSIAKGPGAESGALRKEGVQAADTAVRLDPSNSEALALKSWLIDPGDLLDREALLQRAMKARPLACGCEHFIYGMFLAEVGRNRDATAEFQRSADVLALDPQSQLGLAELLYSEGKAEDARPHLESAIDLSSDPTMAQQATLYLVPVTNDYGAAIKAARDPSLTLPTDFRQRLIAALEAIRSKDPAARSSAAAGLVALPPDMEGGFVATLLGALGANDEALKRVEDFAATGRLGGRASLFYPSMADARARPAFPAVAQRLGLMKYWRASHTRPDACAAKGPPPFCRMI